MDAKTYLNRLKQMDARVSAKLEELENLTALATKTTSVMGGERVQSSSTQDKMAECVAKIADLQKDLREDIVDLLKQKEKAMQLIDEWCEADCITLLYYRYLDSKKWEHIAIMMNYSVDWVKRGLHGKALLQLQNGLDREGLNDEAD